ncbi:MAG: hypothetical protein AAF357_16475, partial [Verrucomicrobiota bacterium]
MSSFRRIGLTSNMAVRAALFAVILGLQSISILYAHKVSSVSLISHLDTEEGTYLLDAAMEVVPSDDDLLNEQIPPEEAARELAAHDKLRTALG